MRYRIKLAIIPFNFFYHGFYYFILFFTRLTEWLTRYGWLNNWLSADKVNKINSIKCTLIFMRNFFYEYFYFISFSSQSVCAFPVPFFLNIHFHYNRWWLIHCDNSLFCISIIHFSPFSCYVSYRCVVNYMVMW